MIHDSTSIDRSRSVAPPPDHRPSGVLGGVSLTFGWRLVDRLLSLVSTPILARLLAPEDFGLVGMASLAAGLVGVFLDMGVSAALVQQRSPTAEHYDAGWTLRLIQTMTVGLIVFAISWPAADYFSEARLAPVVQVVALTTAIAGFENIGTVLFQRTLDFRAEFRFFVIRRAIVFAITMALAFWLRTYWAIIIGALAAKFVSIALSYAFHPFRPRLSLRKAREIFSFSQWSILRGMGSYVSNALPSLVLGKYVGAAALGTYGAAGELAYLASTEILTPASRVLYPKLVEARDSIHEFQRAVVLAIGVQSLLTIPACVGLALVADEAVAVLLGAKWTEAAPLLQLLSLGYLLAAVRHTGGYTLMSLGQIRTDAILVWMEAIATAGLIFSFLQGIDALTLAWIRVGVTLFTAIAFGTALCTTASIPATRVVKAIARPLIACIVMAGTLTAMDPWLPGAPIAALLTRVCIGALAYSVALVALWTLMNRPEGGESYLLGKFAEARNRALSRRAHRKAPLL